MEAMDAALPLLAPLLLPPSLLAIAPKPVACQTLGQDTTEKYCTSCGCRCNFSRTPPSRTAVAKVIPNAR